MLGPDRIFKILLKLRNVDRIEETYGKKVFYLCKNTLKVLVLDFMPASSGQGLPAMRALDNIREFFYATRRARAMAKAKKSPKMGKRALQPCPCQVNESKQEDSGGVPDLAGIPPCLGNLLPVEINHGHSQKTFECVIRRARQVADVAGRVYNQVPIQSPEANTLSSASGGKTCVGSDQLFTFTYGGQRNNDASQSFHSRSILPDQSQRQDENRQQHLQTLHSIYDTREKSAALVTHMDRFISAIPLESHSRCDPVKSALAPPPNAFPRLLHGSGLSSFQPATSALMSSYAMRNFGGTTGGHQQAQLRPQHHVAANTSIDDAVQPHHVPVRRPLALRPPPPHLLVPTPQPPPMMTMTTTTMAPAAFAPLPPSTPELASATAYLLLRALTVASEDSQPPPWLTAAAEAAACGRPAAPAALHASPAMLWNLPPPLRYYAVRAALAGPAGLAGRR